MSVIPNYKIPSNANIVSSHVLNKVKQNNDGSLKLKARISHHFNDKNMRPLLTNDCTTFLPTDLRILESIATL